MWKSPKESFRNVNSSGHYTTLLYKRVDMSRLTKMEAKKEERNVTQP